MIPPDQRTKLQEAWQKSGNPDCDHPATDVEEGTGGKVCTVCGATRPKGRMKPGIEYDPEPVDDEEG